MYYNKMYYGKFYHRLNSLWAITIAFTVLVYYRDHREKG